MAKKRGKNLDSKVTEAPVVVAPPEPVVAGPKEFTAAERQYIIANFKGLSVTQLSRDVGCNEEEVKQFVLDLIKTPGAGRSKDTFARKGGVTLATEVASQRGDEHKKRAASNFSQFSGAIHKPLG